jgi:hypothetical protein
MRGGETGKRLWGVPGARMGGWLAWDSMADARENEPENSEDVEDDEDEDDDDEEDPPNRDEVPLPLLPPPPKRDETLD